MLPILLGNFSPKMSQFYQITLQKLKFVDTLFYRKDKPLSDLVRLLAIKALD
jgi:hypothetical protein